MEPMEPISGAIIHPKFQMWLRPDGIVQVVWVPGTTARLEDAMAAMAAIARLSGGRPVSALVDMRDHGSWDRPTRAAWARLADQMKAVALIVGTPLSRTMGNLFIRMNRPVTPMRLFDDEASALAWLRRPLH